MNETPFPMIVCARTTVGFSLKVARPRALWSALMSCPSHLMTCQPSADQSAAIGTGMTSSVCPEICT